jgi:hypothetical protein
MDKKRCNFCFVKLIFERLSFNSSLVVDITSSRVADQKSPDSQSRYKHRRTKTAGNCGGI